MKKYLVTALVLALTAGAVTAQSNLFNPFWSLQRLAGELNEQFTQYGLGQVLHPQTASESAEGITPTNYWYEPGNVLRYGENTTAGPNGS